MRYPRDMKGYGTNAPKAPWPNQANISVQFVVNYEEGGENNILHGDKASEAFLSEIVGAAAWPDMRHWNMESIYEYGARRGFGVCMSFSPPLISLSQYTALPLPLSGTLIR